MNEFVAIDVETANESLASICQVGLARFRDNEVVAQFETLVNPNEYFTNTWVHGIDENDVKDAPTFADVFSKIQEHLRNSVAVHHTHFDRAAFNKASEYNNLPRMDTHWLDSACVARRAWTQFKKRGYGLANLCEHIGHEFRHHDALEDAKAAGHVMLSAIEESGVSLEEWLTKVKIKPKRQRISIAREGVIDGALYGETIVFTGQLHMLRQEAADIASLAGCDVGTSVTKKTTLLVVGDQDLKKLAGHDKSSKHRRALALIEQGQDIRILQESDFISIIEYNNDDCLSEECEATNC